MDKASISRQGKSGNLYHTDSSLGDFQTYEQAILWAIDMAKRDMPGWEITVAIVEVREET